MWVCTVISRRWIRSGWVGRATRIATSASRMLRSTSPSPMISDTRMSGWRSMKSGSCATSQTVPSPIVALTRSSPAAVSRLSPSAVWTDAIRLATSLAACEQDLALLGEHEPARMPMEQRGSEILLERADLTADRRLAQAQTVPPPG